MLRNLLTRKSTNLGRMLKKNPGYIYVENTFMAVMLPDGKILAIKGNFKNITADEANLKIQNALADLQK